jgi:CRISPR-associated protein Csm5
MPILRECLRPGSRIEFELSIDPRLCPYTAPQIERAAQLFVQNYQQCFRGAFPQPTALPQQGLLYLGGGCGYATKTMLYPLLGAQGIRQVSRVIDATLPYAVSKQHGHGSDQRKGASPHMLKCTRCNGRLYEMGACRMTIL